MTIDAYILYAFLAVVLIITVCYVVITRKANTEKAARDARIKVATARYKANREACSAAPSHETE